MLVKHIVESTENYQQDNGRLFKLVTECPQGKSVILLPKPCYFTPGDVLYSRIREAEDDVSITAKGVRFHFHTVSRHMEDSNTWIISIGGIPAKIVTSCVLNLNSRYIMTMDVK